MLRISSLLLILFTALVCSAQLIEDPSRGVKLFAKIGTINNSLKHYSSFEDINNLDFSQINSVDIDNRGRKTKMDSLLLYKLFNNTPHLRYLSIGRNIEIDKFPKIENDNSSLKRLEFSGNALDAISEDIEKLIALKFFSCVGNNISDLPPGFSNLKSLNHLKLAGNNFTVFPEPVLALDKLSTLIISEKIDEIPENIHLLAEIEKFSLISTHVSVLPDAFSKLKKLKILDLYNNKFTEIPPQVLKLSQLEYLSMSQNPVDKSNFIQSMKALKWENITIDVSKLGLNEEEYLEMEKTQPKIKFSKVAYMR